jgi:hypothetical protein
MRPLLKNALFALTLTYSCATGFAAFGQQSCDASAFREAVANASASITKLHEANGKLFQESLAKLRAMSGWTEADYVAKATPFVKDEMTVELDTANQALLAKVQSLEAGNAGTETGRCAMLAEVKLVMEKVVANAEAKWQHMLSKVAQASSRPMAAGFTR